MKVVYLITGSGGSFYCGNCYRDMLYLKAIRKMEGNTATAIPLYLPPDITTKEEGLDTHVFFGAISMFLREKVRFLRNMPVFLEKFFDAAPFLKLASHQAGTTRTEGLEDLTLNMISGDNAFRKDEVDRLVRYLVKSDKPDIIHLSNALIIGLARQLKKRLNVKIVCSLLNEDDWIEDMVEPYKGKAWNMISREAVNVDAFITPSTYYRDLFIKKTGVPGSNISVVPLGFEPETDEIPKQGPHPPAIGYFNRVSYHSGFDKLADAFIDLKNKNMLPGLTLNVCGGYTGDDKPFIAQQIEKIREHGYQKSIKIYPEFHGNKKLEFFRNVDVISVPVRKYDGYGLYILEANSSGVPVVQPATGGFPEIIKITGGGVTYLPDSVEKLSDELYRMLTDNNLRSELGRKGCAGVRSELSLEKMSLGLSNVYMKINF
jgi:glycosyltransferase involved in cell wall biosynthesis